MATLSWDTAQYIGNRWIDLEDVTLKHDENDAPWISVLGMCFDGSVCYGFANS